MNVLRVTAIILSLITIMPIGYGIVPLVTLEIAILTDIFSGQFELDISKSFYDRVLIAGIISLIGQSVMIISFFFTDKTKAILTIIGVLVLLIATFVLTMDPGVDNPDMMILMFSLPFLGTAVSLVVLEIKGLMQSVKTVDAK